MYWESLFRRWLAEPESIPPIVTETFPRADPPIQTCHSPSSGTVISALAVPSEVGVTVPVAGSENQPSGTSVKFEPATGGAGAAAIRPPGPAWEATAATLVHGGTRTPVKPTAEWHMGDQISRVVQRRPLPYLVIVAGEDQFVGGGRPALARVLPQHQGAVGEQALLGRGEHEVIGVRPGALGGVSPVAAGDLPASELRGAFGIEFTQEMPDAVGLVLGHQRRPLAGELFADLLELGKLGARRDPGVVIGEHVRNQYPGRHDQKQDPGQTDGSKEVHRRLRGPGEEPRSRQQCGDSDHRQQQEGCGTGGQRLALDPGRSDQPDDQRSETGAAGDQQQTGCTAHGGRPDAQAGRQHARPDQNDRDEARIRLKSEITDRPGTDVLGEAERLDQVAHLGLIGEWSLVGGEDGACGKDGW